MRVLLLLLLILPSTASALCDAGSTDEDAPDRGQTASHQQDNASADGFHSGPDSATVGFNFTCSGGDCYCGLFNNGTDFWVASAPTDTRTDAIRTLPEAGGYLFRDSADNSPDMLASLVSTGDRVFFGTHFRMESFDASEIMPLMIVSDEGAGPDRYIRLQF